MGPRNPTLEDLKTVVDAVGGTVKIKVAGGIVDRATAEAFLAGGADRLGTSHAIKIVEEAASSPSGKKSSKGATSSASE
jgi:deoxyribose-phosphate aldolase